MAALSAPLPHTLPATLADQLHDVYIAIEHTDREAAAIVRDARERLRVLSYNRWADAKNARTMRQGVARRLRSHAGWRE